MNNEQKSQYEEAYKEGLRVCFEGGERWAAHIYDSPEPHIRKGFYDGWDAQKLAESSGERIH